MYDWSFAGSRLSSWVDPLHFFVFMLISEIWHKQKLAAKKSSTSAHITKSLVFVCKNWERDQTPLLFKAKAESHTLLGKVHLRAITKRLFLLPNLR